MLLAGRIDTISRQRISGWAWDANEPDTPLSLIITADEEVIGRVLANRFRPDLKVAGIGGGRFGFDLWIESKLLWSKRYTISVRRENDGAYLPGSHAVLEAATAFDAAMQADIARVIGAVQNHDDLEARLGFLAQQTEGLLQIHADERGGLHAREARRRRRWTASTGDGERAADPAPGRRALVIDERVPRTERDAASNALLSHMRALQRIGFEVSFAPADLDAQTAHLEAIGIACYGRPWVASIEDVLAREAQSFDLVYLHRASMAARYGALVRHHQGKARLVYSVADLHFLRLARQAEVEQRPELAAQGRVSQTIELMAMWYADAVITHSSYEAKLLAERLPAGKLHVVPWAVPLRPTTRPFAERRGLAFLGGFSHKPNVDAAHWLATTIMPLVGQRDPSITCLLVGSEMPDSLRRVASEHVQAIGAVDDLSAVFDRVRLTVAPLAFGAGIKGKVLDSFAAGIPCLCSPAAAEGLDLPPLLAEQVAADPDTLVRKIRQLHDDEGLNARCSAAGLAYIAAFAAEDRIDALMRKVAGVAAL